MRERRLREKEKVKKRNELEISFGKFCGRFLRRWKVVRGGGEV